MLDQDINSKLSKDISSLNVEDENLNKDSKKPSVKSTIFNASTAQTFVPHSLKQKEKEDTKKRQEETVVKNSCSVNSCSVNSSISLEKKTEKKNGSTNITNKVEMNEVNDKNLSKNDIEDEELSKMYITKENLSIIFMGHVDAGKSTMGGNILYLTGVVDKRVIEKYEREAKDAGRQSWYLSWILDTNKDERNDGKTIEVCKAFFETEKKKYIILDAPGHKLYVSEMIGSASQADVGVLVISARKGEYETGFEKGGQTREHALLAKTQGVSKMVVAVNKMDDPTVEWSEARYNECIFKVLVFLKNIGLSKDDVFCLPVSGYHGYNLKDRVDPSICSWYKGPSLLEYLDNLVFVRQTNNNQFVMPISSKMRDLGVIIEGKIESGFIKKGASLTLMPIKKPVEILSIYSDTEQELEFARCGEIVRLKIKGVEEDEISIGYVLSLPQSLIKVATSFEAQIYIVELKQILCNGFSCVMHIHTAIEEVKIDKLLHKFEKGTNRKSKRPPPFAKKGMRVSAILKTQQPLCVEPYNDHPTLGKFTLRDQGTTIAFGKIQKLL